jgi:hypothetical protein
MAHFALAQVQCAQRLTPSLQTMQIFGNIPLQSLAFMQAFGCGEAGCALAELPSAAIPIATTEKIKRSRLLISASQKFPAHARKGNGRDINLSGRLCESI